MIPTAGPVTVSREHVTLRHAQRMPIARLGLEVSRELQTADILHIHAEILPALAYVLPRNEASRPVVGQKNGPRPGFCPASMLLQFPQTTGRLHAAGRFQNTGARHAHTKPDSKSRIDVQIRHPCCSC